MRGNLTTGMVVGVLALALGCSSSGVSSVSDTGTPTTVGIGSSATGSATTLTVLQDEGVQPARHASDGCRYELTPYVWLAGIDGKHSARRVTMPVEADFTNLFRRAEWAPGAHFEARRDRWTFFLDCLYLHLTDGRHSLLVFDGEEPQRVFVETDMDVELLLGEIGAAYRLLEFPCGWTQDQVLAVEVLGGGRYWYLENEFESTPGTRIEASKDWVDPFVGARLFWRLSRRCAVGIRGDVGGFDIGSASEFTWNVLGGIDYQVWDGLSVKVGYRILDVDRVRAGFGLDTQLAGPWVGLSLDF